MRADVTLKLCANDMHFCAQMKTVRKRFFLNERKCNNTVQYTQKIHVFIRSLCRRSFKFIQLILKMIRLIVIFIIGL